MSRSLLLAHLTRLANGAPAVQRLRRFALDLAVRGQLSTAPTHGDSVERLIRDIDRTRERAWLAPKLAALALRPVAIEEQPFAVPGDWAWTRLGRIATYIQRGKSPTYAVDRGRPVVSQKCIRWEGLDLVPARMITEESLGKYMPDRFLREGDLLWNSTGTGTIGRVALALDPPDRLVCDGHVTVVRCSQVDPRYIQLWLRSDHVFGRIEDDASGATNQVELTLQMAVSQVVPLPPIEEQHRIVAMVGDLFALCDELDTNRVKREGTRDRLRAVSLARLTAPTETPGKVPQKGVTFFLSHSDRMVTEPKHVGDLRQTVRNLAASGALGRHDLSSWQRTKLRDACASIVYGTSVKADSPADGVPVLRMGNIVDGQIVFKDLKYLRPEQVDARLLLEPGDLVFNRTNSAELVGKNAVFLGYGQAVTFASYLIRVRPKSDLDMRWIHLALTSNAGKQYLSAAQSQMTGQANINGTKLGNFDVVLPPLSVQVAVCERVGELMTVCDQLEQALRSAEEGRSKLLEAVLREALNGRPVDTELTEATA